jgi:NAD dependent epimerase/dehydratase family enzyme
MAKLRTVITGGSGQIGQILARHFHAYAHEVIVLSRHSAAMPWRTVLWDARTVGPWSRELDRADLVINLAGRSVNCRYTPANRREIKESRVQSTLVLGEAIARATHPPALWINASTATIYRHAFDRAMDEHTGELGGTSGSGRQYVSWVHDADFLSAIDFLVARPELEGVVNISSPEPLPNREFMRALRRAWGTPIGLAASRWMLEIGAVFLRTETELILKSRRAVPTRLLQAGFEFRFPAWPDAVRDLVSRWRERS